MGSLEPNKIVAIESLKRAQKAIDTGVFKGDGAVTVKIEKATMSWIWMSNLETLNLIRFSSGQLCQDGTVTAANSSSISDGAAAVILMSEHVPQRRALNRWLI